MEGSGEQELTERKNPLECVQAAKVITKESESKLNEIDDEDAELYASETDSIGEMKQIMKSAALDSCASRPSSLLCRSCFSVPCDLSHLGCMYEEEEPGSQEENEDDEKEDLKFHNCSNIEEEPSVVESNENESGGMLQSEVTKERVVARSLTPDTSHKCDMAESECGSGATSPTPFDLFHNICSRSRSRITSSPDLSRTIASFHMWKQQQQQAASNGNVINHHPPPVRSNHGLTVSNPRVRHSSYESSPNSDNSANFSHSFTGTDQSPVFLRSLTFRSKRHRPRVSDPLPFAHELFLLGRRRSSSPKPFSQLSRFHDLGAASGGHHYHHHHHRRSSDISPLHQSILLSDELHAFLTSCSCARLRGVFPLNFTLQQFRALSDDDLKDEYGVGESRDREDLMRAVARSREVADEEEEKEREREERAREVRSDSEFMSPPPSSPCSSGFANHLKSVAGSQDLSASMPGSFKMQRQLSDNALARRGSLCGPVGGGKYNRRDSIFASYDGHLGALGAGCGGETSNLVRMRNKLLGNSAPSLTTSFKEQTYSYSRRGSMATTP